MATKQPIKMIILDCFVDLQSFLAKSIRSHWGIESMHWVLDVVFNEDASSIRQGNAPANMVSIRGFVLNILNRIKTKRRDQTKNDAYYGLVIK